MITPEPDVIVWRKSSYSGNGADCVEVGWRKSSYSNGGTACGEVGWRKSSYSNGGDACVEVATTPPGVAVRDSKYPTGSMLTFSLAPWRAFVTTL
jgi:hypothetical protein